MPILRETARILKLCASCGEYAMVMSGRNTWICGKCDTRSNGNCLDWSGWVGFPGEEIAGWN